MQDDREVKINPLKKVDSARKVNVKNVEEKIILVSFCFDVEVHIVVINLVEDNY